MATAAEVDPWLPDIKVPGFISSRFRKVLRFLLIELARWGGNLRCNRCGLHRLYRYERLFEASAATGCRWEPASKLEKAQSDSESGPEISRPGHQLSRFKLHFSTFMNMVARYQPHALFLIFKIRSFKPLNLLIFLPSTRNRGDILSASILASSEL